MKKHSVLMVSSEAVPLAKSGGLGDVVSALSAELKRRGHDVRIVLPRYYSISKTGLTAHSEPLGVPVGFQEEWCGIFETRLPGTEVPVYLLEHEGLFGRDGIYGDPGGSEYPDNAKRFTLLSRGAFQLCRYLEWIPDVLHGHDWQAALVPVYLNTWEREREFKDTAGVLTVHNLGYQGVFPKTDINLTQLRWEHFHDSGFEFYDRLNFLQAGIKNADIITTVSPTYSREIQTPAFGFDMDGILRGRNGDLFGVLNGIDYEVWNPESDPHLPANYSAEDLSGKEVSKKELQKRCGFPEDPNIPVIGMVTRLADQKGIGDLAGPDHGSLYSLCSDFAVQVVIVGTGEKWCEEELKSLDKRLENLKVFLAFDNPLAHLVEGGSDFFLMPSKYEPCGLNQMYSLRYGTLPIVRRTGGLADTVDNYDQLTGEGTGFVFEELSPRSIYDTAGWAVWTWFNRREHIREMRKRAMEKRFTWEKSAERYAELYRWAVDRRRRIYPHAR